MATTYGERIGRLGVVRLGCSAPSMKSASNPAHLPHGQRAGTAGRRPDPARGAEFVHANVEETGLAALTLMGVYTARTAWSNTRCNRCQIMPELGGRTDCGSLA
jgi:hypothetical protein